jgi:hypothetical protein
MSPPTPTVKAGPRSACQPRHRSRVDIVRSQLARTDAEWAKAVSELREVLIGIAGELDLLEARVRELESPDSAS